MAHRARSRSWGQHRVPAPRPGAGSPRRGVGADSVGSVLSPSSTRPSSLVPAAKGGPAPKAAEPRPPPPEAARRRRRNPGPRRRRRPKAVSDPRGPDAAAGRDALHGLLDGALRSPREAREVEGQEHARGTREVAEDEAEDQVVHDGPIVGAPRPRVQKTASGVTSHTARGPAPSSKTTPSAATRPRFVRRDATAKRPRSPGRHATPRTFGRAHRAPPPTRSPTPARGLRRPMDSS